MPKSKFIAVYRISLVKDAPLPFERCRLQNSQQAQTYLRKLIETNGQPDREQFCVILLNVKNDIIGLNIVSIGSVCATTVHPREVLKPAILANATGIILCHNHPSDDVEPSEADKLITRAIIKAAIVMDIQIHEHLIISMHEDRFYSFCDNGLIDRYYRDA